MSHKETQVFFKKAKIEYIEGSKNINGFSLHYIQTGDNEASTLFFVHGSPGSWDAYKDFLKDSLLLSKYRMIAVDRIGFGNSNFGEAQNLETHASNLEKFIQTFDNKKPVYLIGHSLGGSIIVKMAIDKPNDYKSIIILAGAVDPQAEKPEKWRVVIKQVPLRYLIPGALRTSNDELWWLKDDLIQMKSNLYKIKTDVVIVHGTKDPLVPFSNVAFMEKEFKNAKTMKVIPIENANHFIPWEHYTEIRDLLFHLE